MYRALHGECLRLVPGRVLAELEVHCRSNAAHNMLMAAELLDAISCLQRRGVEAVPFKGPVSAVSAHGSLAYREFGDLDVLVRRQDLTDALSVLRDSGYSLDPDTGDLEDHLNRLHEVRLWKKTAAGLAILLELHWRLAPSFEGMQVTADELMTETASLKLLGKEVVVLRPELELLAACVGGAKTCWHHMEGACVVSALICGDRIRDWGFLRRKASGFGLTRALNLGLGLGQCLSESAASSTDTTGGQAGQMIAPLRDRVLQSWTAPGERWPVSDWSRFQLKVRERV
ncbi:MAG: nucleotidyltransferase family protein, partial [Planctomycetota bacterium]